ncbi:unnamed protein product [Zymoseptoria tritici ST99CH_3D7]|uniref:Uncharacterized protein n=1 Tax=Zymoseptoria tritici (strain ST99CH_3D7) TaxID=1276538 RepID=A0A1X7RZP2_ZYMT9|nr:unnamed protein product [Zymoseptoria tritici ST99CH_3D7]
MINIFIHQHSYHHHAGCMGADTRDHSVCTLSSSFFGTSVTADGDDDSGFDFSRSQGYQIDYGCRRRSALPTWRPAAAFKAVRSTHPSQASPRLPILLQEGRGDTSATRAHSRADQRQLPRVSLNTLETRGGNLHKHKFDKSQTEWGGQRKARPIQPHQSVRLDPAHPNKYKFAWSASADQVKHRKVSGIKSEKKHPVELLNLDSTADDGPPHQLIHGLASIGEDSTLPNTSSTPPAQGSEHDNGDN